MSLTINETQLNPRRLKAIQSSYRKNLVLGRVVTPYRTGFKKGSIAWYRPSPYSSLVENTFIYGSSGSGKSWGGYNLFGQSFFAERRTCVLIDTKLSIPRESLLYVRINGKEQIITIGELVDKIIPKNDITSMASPVFDNIETLSVCRDHKIRWKNIPSVSKHKSPQRMIKILTTTNREVISTEGHSYITLKNGKYQSIKGSDLKVGDYLPLAEKIPFGNLEEINVLEYFNDNEILDFDNVISGINMATEMPVITAYNNCGLSTITYGAFVRYNKGEREIESSKFKCITKNNSKSSHFPKVIKLTKDFGFFCGMFVAEGYASDKKGKKHITITNYEHALKEKLKEWLDDLEIPYFEKEKNTVINCLPLTKLFVRWFGDGMSTSSKTKHLPDFVFNGNEEFIKGFLDGYMSGDGYIREMPKQELFFSTISDQLATDLNLLFSKFGMNTRINKTKKITYCRFSSSDITKFREIGFTHPKKQERLNEYETIGEDSKHLIDLQHVLEQLPWWKHEYPSTRSMGDKTRRRNKKGFSRAIIKRSYNEIKDDYPEQARKLLKLIESECTWDRIKKIEFLEPTSDFVYDLQVDDTENFILANGIFVHNSYNGMWRPNIEYIEELRDVGLIPRGIPSSQIDIIAPKYFLDQKPPDEIIRTRVTQPYMIPLVLCGLGIMFELTKLRRKAQYASTFDATFHEVMKETNRNPTLDDLFDKINEETEADDFPSRMKWVFELMMKKITEIADLAIDDTHPWSAIGRCLMRAAYERKPRWIVFTLGHSNRPQDDVLLAMVTAVLSEVKAFMYQADLHNWDIRVGTMIDELHTFTRNKDASSEESIHDLIFAWGRSAGLWRVFMTQKNEQLSKVFRDEIEEAKTTGTFQNIIKFRRTPDAGYGTLLDRLNPASQQNIIADQPRIIPNIKFCPPIMEVESKIYDELKWKEKHFGNALGITEVESRREDKPWARVLTQMFPQLDITRSVQKPTMMEDLDKLYGTHPSSKSKAVERIFDRIQRHLTE